MRQRVQQGCQPRGPVTLFSSAQVRAVGIIGRAGSLREKRRMKILHGVQALGCAAVFVFAGGLAPMVHGSAQSVDHGALTGAWTLNSDLSDAPPSAANGEGGDQPTHTGARPSGGRRG